MLTNSQFHYEEGKKNLISKDYKEAIKCFTNSLRVYPANKDSKFFRAICFLDNDNPKKCIQDLNELIETDPYYS